MKFKKLLSLGSSFILGFMLAIAVFNLLISKKLDQMYFYQRSLKSELEYTKLTLEKLKEDKSSLSKHTIKEIRVVVDSPLEVYKQDIEENIRMLLKDVIGRDIETLDVPMMTQLIDQRVLLIEDKKIILTLKSLVVSKTTTVIIRAKEVQQ